MVEIPPTESRLKQRQFPHQFVNLNSEQKIFVINGKEYTDKNEAAAAASKAIFG